MDNLKYKDEKFQDLEQTFNHNPNNPIELWPKPEIISNTLLPVDEFSIHLLPEILQDWIDDVSFRMQCPADFVAVGIIIMIGSIIGCGCGVKPKQHDNWIVVPNLWGAVIGRPSIVKKTPALREALSPLKKLEHIATENYENNLKNYGIDLEIYDAQKSALKSNLKRESQKNSAVNIDRFKSDLSSLAPPKKPLLKRYQTNDSTVEKIGELLSENHRGILLYRDELVGLLATWEKMGHESDRAFYLESWNGNSPYKIDRIARGSITVPHLCVSLLGTIQPDKLTYYLHKCTHELSNDGLIQRLQLAVFPDEPKLTLKTKETDKAPNQLSKEKVCKNIKKIADTDFTILGLQNINNLPCFSFNQEAQEHFYTLIDNLDTKIKSEQNPFVMEHLGKYRSLIPSIALIFHVISNIDNINVKTKINIDTLQQAELFSNYLEKHARRIYGLMENISIKGAASLAEKIKKREIKDKFTLRDIYRKNWRFLKDKCLAKNAVDELIDANWLKKETTQGGHQQKPKEFFIINPRIFAENAKRRTDNTDIL
ncbi:MAG: YfjI family protein [Gammaproteobacteria bacterium]|jgi:putative DNA primase/helicase